MSEDIFCRNKIIWGDAFQRKLENIHIAVFGLGGVGGYAIDSLTRAGIGEFSIVDFDDIHYSNLNRQLIALNSTIGKKKTQLFKNRILDINKNAKVNVYDCFYTDDLNEKIFKNKKVDYVIDAIDTIKSKIELIKYCYQNNIKIITSFGAGNRLDASYLTVCDISKIEKTNCNFLKNIIRILKKEGIENNLPVCYSKEKPQKISRTIVKSNIEYLDNAKKTHKINKISPGSTPFVVAVSGYLMGNYVCLDLIKNK